MTRSKLALAALCLLVAVSANALVNRSFVASTGNDANDCSRATPCRSFTAALAVTNANGEIIALDSAGYGSSLTINTSISVIAPTGIYAGMTSSSGDAITVNAPSAVVVLRGLYLNAVGGMRGIVANDVGALHIENCVVAGFQESGIEFYAASSSASLFVNDTTSRRNGNTFHTGAGIRVQGTDATHQAYASIENCRLEQNGSGGLATVDAGVVAFEYSQVTVRHSVVAGNARGITVGGPFALITVEDSEVSGNIVGLLGTVNQGAQLRVSNTVITHNTLYAIEAPGLNVTSRGNNTLIDNAAAEIFSGTFAAQ